MWKINQGRKFPRRCNLRKCLREKRVFTELLVTPFTLHFSLIGILFYAKCQPNYYSWNFNNQYLKKKKCKIKIRVYYTLPSCYDHGCSKNGRKSLDFTTVIEGFLTSSWVAIRFTLFYVLCFKIFFYNEKKSEVDYGCIMKLSLDV